MTQTATPVALATLDDLIQQAGGGNPIRVAVVNAAQAAVLETLREAARLGIAEPVLIGRPAEIVEAAAALMYRAGIRLPVPSSDEAESTFCCSPQPESACCPREAR